MGLFKFLFGPKSPVYQRYLIVGNSQDHFLWEKKTWKLLETFLDSLFKDIKGPINVRVDFFNSKRKGQIKSKTYKWGLLNNQKWVQDGEILNQSDFINIQIKAPNSTYCKKNRIWPYLYIEISKPFSEYYNQVIHLAVNPRFQERKEIEELIDLIKSKISPVFAAKTESAWFDKKSESKTIDAFMTTGFSYRNGHLDTKPDLSKIDGNWEEF